MADVLTLPALGDPERARFDRFIVRGPGERDCHFWTGSISDDGYGRFWLMRDGRQRVVRPHRYALMLELGRPLTDSEFAIHEVCDNPICVWATTSIAGRPHVVAGTQSQNLADEREGARRRPGAELALVRPGSRRPCGAIEGSAGCVAQWMGRRRGGIRVASHGHSDTLLTSERHEKMSENFTPRERSAVEAAAYQATKHTQKITDADLVAVVEGLTGTSVAQTPRIDIAFPAAGDPDELFH